MAIKTTDTIETTQANSGGAKVTRTLAELNTLISSEESARLGDLEAVYPGIGAPDVATQSEAILREDELDEITLTSVAVGAAENDYTIKLIVPKTVNATRTLALAGSVISVTVKTELSGEDVIVSASETATAIAAAISAHGTIGLLFQAAATGTGTTVIAASDSVAPTGGQDATIAVIGKTLIDAANNLVYLCIADTDGTETVLDDNWQTLELTAIRS